MKAAIQLVALTLCLSASASALLGQTEDGGVSYDSHGEELLESIAIPPVTHAPFSLQLATEWTRPMNNGGTFTIVNSRPIKRDSMGRIYQERWLLAPKDTKIQSRMSWIQIADPVTHTLLECNALHKVCELEDWRGWDQAAAKPELAISGPLKSGRGTHVHEVLGAQFFAGVPVHVYKETTTLNPGTMGNNLPLVTVREFRFSPALGIDLSSVIDTPRLGKQLFTVTEITTTEPDPRWFQTPEGYSVRDLRKAAHPSN